LVALLRAVTRETLRIVCQSMCPPPRPLSFGEGDIATYEV
jgi:hypothetical protein